jgi:hypothetical protein
MLLMSKKRPPLSPEALEFFKKQGRIGGTLGGAKAWEGLTAAQRTKRAKRAAETRLKNQARKTP